MSYCVNCGVKLNETEPVCPLCECPVTNPMKDKELPENLERPYPKRRDTVKNIVDRQFIVMVISILYLLPIIICIAVDVNLSGTITWSLISTVSVVLCWAIIFLPFLMNKKFTILYLTIDLTLLTALFLSIAWYVNQSNWVMILAVPIAAAVYIALNMMVYGITIGLLRELYIGTFAVSSLGILCVIIELLVWNYKKHYIDIGSKFIGWSLFVFISCVIIAGLLCYIEKKKSIKRGLEKRFHI